MPRPLHGPVALAVAGLLLVAGIVGELSGRKGLLGDAGLVAIVIALAVLALAVPWASGRPWADRDETRRIRRR